MVAARVTDLGEAIPYASAPLGTTINVQAGDLELGVDGVEPNRPVLFAYDVRRSGRHLADLEFVVRKGRAGTVTVLSAVPASVETLRVRIGDRLEVIPVEVVPGV